MTITEFYAARLDETEAAAKAAWPGPWTYETETGGFGPVGWVRVPITQTKGAFTGLTTFTPLGTTDADTCAHIALHDPARVLREVEAKRKILMLHDRMSVLPGHPMFNDAHLTREPMVLCRSCEPETMFRRTDSWPCRTLRALAAVYSDHPDWREDLA